MAKRTLRSKYETQDATLSRHRQLLSGDADLPDIYYEVDPRAPVAALASGNSTVTNDSPPPYTASVSDNSAAPKPSPAHARTRAGPRSSKKPDAPITALEIIIGIVAPKLKKSLNEIAVTSTIKYLASGTFPRSEFCAHCKGGSY